MTDFKQQILSELDILKHISLMETAGEFKSRTYEAAIKTISALQHVRSMEDIPASQKGDGLGKEVRIKLEKILTNGSLTINDNARALAVKIKALLQIYGVGPKKAQELIAQMPKDLSQQSTIEWLNANTKLLNRNQKIGLQYYEQLQTRIPRVELDRHAALLTSAIPKGVIVGSYRRGRPDSGDIDMLIPDGAGRLEEYVSVLKACGYIREVLAMGAHKCLAISQLPGPEFEGKARRLDLLVTPPSEFPFALFYFTGCDTFNVAVRSHALTQGFTLNEHAITHIQSGKPVLCIKKEETIFKLLKLKWVEPVDRTGPNAVVVDDPVTT